MINGECWVVSRSFCQRNKGYYTSFITIKGAKKTYSLWRGAIVLLTPFVSVSPVALVFNA